MKTKNETNAEYHSEKSISASGLKTIYKKSVYHHLNKKPFESKSMNLGSAVHAIMLEGMKVFNTEFYITPKIDARTKAGKLEKAKHLEIAGDRKLLSPEDMEIIYGIMESFKTNKMAQYYCDGQVEISHYSDYNGVPIKVRPDCFNSQHLFISDVKTCQDNSPRAFKSDIYKYSYHLQAVCYCKVMGYPIENFRFIAVETKYPYSIQLYALGEDLIEQGVKAFEQSMNDWKMYIESGLIVGYSGKHNELDDSIIL